MDCTGEPDRVKADPPHKKDRVYLGIVPCSLSTEPRALPKYADDKQYPHSFSQCLLLPLPPFIFLPEISRIVNGHKLPHHLTHTLPYSPLMISSGW